MFGAVGVSVDAMCECVCALVCDAFAYECILCVSVCIAICAV